MTWHGRGIRLEARNRRGETPLFSIIRYVGGSLAGVQVAKFYLAQGARADHRNAMGQNPLFPAGLSGRRPELTRLLLAAGANPECRDSNRETPLTYAVREGPLETIRMLLQAGTDPRAANRHGVTALARARRLKRWDVVRLLVP